MNQTAYQSCLCDTNEFIKACKSPDTTIQLHEGKDQNRNQRIYENGMKIRLEIFFWNLTVPTVKPYPKRCKVGRYNGNKIKQYQKKRNLLPVWKEFIHYAVVIVLFLSFFYSHLFFTQSLSFLSFLYVFFFLYFVYPTAHKAAGNRTSRCVTCLVKKIFN